MVMEDQSLSDEEEEIMADELPAPTLALAQALAPVYWVKRKIKIKVKMGAPEKDKVPSKYEDDEKEQLKKESVVPTSQPLKRRYKEKSGRVVDKCKEFEKLKEKLQAARPKKKRKLMHSSIPIGRDNMETLFEQHKLHNQG